MNKLKLIIFTDGSTSGLERQLCAGAYVIVYDRDGECQNNIAFKESKYYGAGNISYAELITVIISLKKLMTLKNYHYKIESVKLYTDSEYVIHGVKKNIKWQENNWTTSSGTEIPYKNMWIELNTLMNHLKNVSIDKVKAHQKDSDFKTVYNNAVHKMAYKCLMANLK